MKTFKYIGIAVMAAIMSFGLPSPSKVNAQPGVAVSFNIFYNSLSPYGHWINHAHYGSVWIPSVPRDFHPYMTNGRWVMTEFGNTWVSDYAWGWAPFHYGRWFYDDFYGWAWVPDYVWGPGWVNWRNGGGYYGWGSPDARTGHTHRGQHPHPFLDLCTSPPLHARSLASLCAATHPCHQDLQQYDDHKQLLRLQ